MAVTYPSIFFNRPDLSNSVKLMLEERIEG